MDNNCVWTDIHTPDIGFELIQPIGVVFSSVHWGKCYISLLNYIFNNTITFLCRCLARARTKDDGELEVVETQHNHGLLMERRKKGTLKAMYDEKKRQRNAEQKWFK